jgi:hypothetical protein
MNSFFRFILLISFWGISYNITNAQSLCPPDTGTNCTYWQVGFYNTVTDAPKCTLTVNYRWRNCDGNYQIYIDSMSRTGNCEMLSQGESMSSFQEWLDLVLIEEISNLPGQYTPLDCPNTNQKVIFYTATCGVWVKCEYIINEENRVCGPDWRGSMPDYDAGGVKKINFWKWQSCGITCCKKTYHICRQAGTGGNGYSIQIKSVSKMQIGNCSNPENFVTPCESGC